MAEYANMITVSCMATLLFLGGWVAPWPAEYGSRFVPVALFAAAVRFALVHGFKSRAPAGPVLATGRRSGFPDRGRHFSGSPGPELAAAAVLGLR